MKNGVKNIQAAAYNGAHTVNTKLESCKDFRVRTKTLITIKVKKYQF